MQRPFLALMEKLLGAEQGTAERQMCTRRKGAPGTLCSWGRAVGAAIARVCLCAAGRTHTAPPTPRQIQPPAAGSGAGRAMPQGGQEEKGDRLGRLLPEHWAMSQGLRSGSPAAPRM